MSDTKRMEMIAENLIAHFLQRHGILVAKPYFDVESGDLLAMTTEGEVRSCRIQCKGRTARPGEKSNVEINVEHVKDSMIVCLFIDDGSFDGLNLFVFFREDIEQWPKTPDGKKYRVTFSNDNFSQKFAGRKISHAVVERIANEVMKVGLPTTASYKYTMSGGIAVEPQAAAEAAAAPPAVHFDDQGTGGSGDAAKAEADPT